MNTPYLKNNAPVGLAEFTRAALEPAHSVVVRACAGSGKTWLLTSRIIRLLIAGVVPKHILAITFTKKAAQEMRDRVAQLLREMADGTPEQVVELLTMRGLSIAQAEQSVVRAQMLYDEILGAGQELPIYTFDAWFYRLLKAAPMGSGVARDAVLLTDADELRESAWQGFFELFNRPEGERIRTHYLNLIERMGAHNTENMLNAALYLSNEFELWLDGVGGTVEEGLLALQNEILAQTGLDVGIGAEGIAHNAHQAIIASGALAVVVRSLGAGDDKKVTRAEHLQKALDADDTQVFWEIVNQYVATSTGLLNGTQFKLEKKQKATMQGAGISEDDYVQAVAQVNSHLDEAHAQSADLSAYQIHEDMLPCVFALLELYRQHKRDANAVEFADVSRQCFELLNSPETAAFMQTALDARYRHLLFDEFQDTNPVQWGIIHGWLSAYQGDAHKPCVFLVGDVKQSIYRFRDADSTLFATAQDYLVNEFDATVLQTQFTRRNSSAVVAWVNRMFERADSQLDDFIAHSTAQTEMVGHIACLGLVKADEHTNDENAVVESHKHQTQRDWLNEPAQVIELTRHDDESAQLVQAIHALVGHYPVWDEQQEHYRPARYADIMILIYGRTHLSSYERLLRQAQIPYESTRRGGLMDTLEALDLMALLKWLTRSDDDWALIQVLRAPMFAISDAQLTQLLMYKRGLEQLHATELSYWQTLAQLAQVDATWRTIYELLNEWLQMAGHAPPHDVLDRIYAQGDIYNAYARVVPTWLNPQVQANLRGFLQLALNVNAGRYPSLMTFLHALERWQERETEGVSEGEPLGMYDAVKILTVHASKGLESPIVMLIDMRTNKKPDIKGNQWFIQREGDAVPTHLSWLGNQSERGRWRAATIARESELNAKEHYNKCYVAMTRAKQMLLVSAAQEMDIQRDDEGNVASTQPSKKMDGLFEALHEESLNLECCLPNDIVQWSALWQAYWKTHPMQSAESVQSTAQGAVDVANSEVLKVSEIAHNAQGLARWRSAFASNTTDALEEQAAQMGVALHSALEWATDTHHPQTVTEDMLVERCALTQAQARTVMQWVTQIMLHPAHQTWFDKTQFDEAHNEMALVDAQGQVKRMDRWVRHGQSITILDYKSAWSVENLAVYETQVREYMDLMKQVYPEHSICGVLLRVDGVAHRIE
ncbi:MAG: addA [Burkholderiaceae bacterium]|nr:addA [Burkholderiaceae bacterium]